MVLLISPPSLGEKPGHYTCIFSFSFCTLADKAKHHNTNLLGCILCQCYDFFLKVSRMASQCIWCQPHYITGMGFLTSGKCQTSQAEMLYGRAGWVWISTAEFQLQGGLMVENFKLSFFPLLKINDLDRHHILQLL